MELENKKKLRTQTKSDKHEQTFATGKCFLKVVFVLFFFWCKRENVRIWEIKSVIALNTNQSEVKKKQKSEFGESFCVNVVCNLVC